MKRRRQTASGPAGAWTARWTLLCSDDTNKFLTKIGEIHQKAPFPAPQQRPPEVENGKWKSEKRRENARSIPRFCAKLAQRRQNVVASGPKRLRRVQHIHVRTAHHRGVQAARAFTPATNIIFPAPAPPPTQKGASALSCGVGLVRAALYCCGWMHTHARHFHRQRRKGGGAGAVGGAWVGEEDYTTTLRPWVSGHLP